MESIIQKRFKESGEIKNRFLKENLARLVEAINLISDAFEKGNKLLLFGNGGSAADAQHIAAEFVNRFIIERPPLPAIALTTDTSVITSVSNDFSFQEVFAKQIKAIGKNGDVALAISTSGTSVNVVRGLEVAREMGMKTIALVGNDGGTIGNMVDIPLVVPSSSTPRIQETHILIGHILCEMVEHRLFLRVNP